MVNNAAIVNVINEITKINGAPCKKTLQKIIYLIQAKHVDLGCDYGIHFYGPYSSDLDFAVRELCDEGTLKIEYTPLEHKICVKDNANIPQFFDNTVNEIINEFAKEKASELELLATALYVYLSDKDIEKVKLGVVKIKGGKYNDKRINDAIKRLQENGFFAA